MSKIKISKTSLIIDDIDIANTVSEMRLYNSGTRDAVLTLDLIIGDFDVSLDGAVMINEIKMPKKISEKIYQWAKKRLKEEG